MKHASNLTHDDHSVSWGAVDTLQIVESVPLREEGKSCARDATAVTIWQRRNVKFPSRCQQRSIRQRAALDSRWLAAFPAVGGALGACERFLFLCWHQLWHLLRFWRLRHTAMLGFLSRWGGEESKWIISFELAFLPVIKMTLRVVRFCRFYTFLFHSDIKFEVWSEGESLCVRGVIQQTRPFYQKKLKVRSESPSNRERGWEPKPDKSKHSRPWATGPQAIALLAGKQPPSCPSRVGIYLAAYWIPDSWFSSPLMSRGLCCRNPTICYITTS